MNKQLFLILATLFSTAVFCVPPRALNDRMLFDLSEKGFEAAGKSMDAFDANPETWVEKN